MANEIIGFKTKDDTAQLVDFTAIANVPDASDSVAGMVKVDNESIKVNSDGQIYVAYQSASGVGF